MVDRDRIDKYIELRRITPKTLFELSSILEQNEGWKVLMSVIPNDTEHKNGSLKYTTEDMRLIEEAANKQGRHCSEILFEEWGTSGRKRPTFKTLLECLLRAELFRAAELVASIISDELPERPRDGPAANIPINKLVDELSGLSMDAKGDTYRYLNNNINYNPYTNETVLSIQLENTALFDEKHVAQHHILNAVDNTRNDLNSGDKYTTSLIIDTVIDQKSKSTKNLSLVSAQCLPYALLKEATNNFSEEFVIGSGAFGTVFCGKINTYNFELAIKVLKNTEEGLNLLKQFQSEVDILSQCNHSNILPLCAISIDVVPCIIYEYMPNGSLEDRLACKTDRAPLDWMQRVKISHGIANGLRYLHFESQKCIVHRDIKSANVLLDKTDIPKIGDFGLVRSTGISRQTVVTETIIGTTAYMSPEAFRGDVSIQMDVYSFGVVLVELITGLPPYDENRDGTDLVTHIDTAPIEDMVDEKAGSWNSQVLTKMIEISERCLLEKKRRPQSKDIYTDLENIVFLLPGHNP